MKSTIFFVFIATMVFAFSACEPNKTPVEEEYDYWLAKHDSSHKYHELIVDKHETMLANHEELMKYLQAEENPDTALMNDMAEHTRFYKEHEQIMNNHAKIMADHDEFRERYEAGKVTDEELKAKLDSMKHDHQHMDIDHEYVKNKTLEIRSEHNDLRRRYNKILEERR